MRPKSIPLTPYDGTHREETILSPLLSMWAADEGIQHWENFRGGDLQAFDLLYYQHIDALYHYGERLSPDKALIEDCLQELFAKLWSRQKQLPEVTSVKFYLFKALKRKMVKKRRQQQSLISDEEYEGYNFEIVFPAEFELTDYQVSNNQKQEILHAVNQLTPRQKEVITLRFYDNFNYDEIASIMSLSTRSVYNLTYRALAVLRRVLTTDSNQCST